MNASARGSPDWPSQKKACLRTSRFRWLRAISISFGTAWSLGSCESAKTAFFFTSVSGSFSMAPTMIAAARSPAFCASQKSAWPRTCADESLLAAAMIGSSASGCLLTERAKTRLVANLLARVGCKDLFQNRNAARSAIGPQPEDRFLADLLRRRWAGQSFQNDVGLGVVMHGDCENGAASKV